MSGRPLAPNCSSARRSTRGWATSSRGSAGSFRGCRREGLPLRHRGWHEDLADLFDGRSQLIVYHFMFGPSWNAGCPACSSIADTLAPQVPHLKARDTTLLLASRASLQKLLAYRERMEWPIDWVSSGRSDFNRDLGLFSTAEELQPFLEGDIPVTVELYACMCGTDPGGYVAGISVYALSDGTVYRTYVTTTGGIEPVIAYYTLLDRTPNGRQESATEPLWIRRHDEYDQTLDPAAPA